MKKQVSVVLVGVGVALMACSHEESKSTKQEAGQANQQAATQTANQSQAQTEQNASTLLGEQNVTSGTAQIQRQKKIVSTVIVKDKIPTVKETTTRADINKMSARQFTAIGFPADVSANIVAYRDRNGAFKSVEDLTHVDGVTQSLLNRFDGALGASRAGSEGISQAGQAGQSDTDS